MKHSFCLSSLSAVLVLAPLALAQQPAPAPRAITIDDYFQLREVRDPQLGPDARWVTYTVKTALLKDDKNEERIWMVPERNRSIPAKLNLSCMTESSMW